jgi:hypothetical protein
MLVHGLITAPYNMKRVSLSLLKPTGTSEFRTTEFSREAMNIFFYIFEADFVKISYPSDRVYNVDTT